MRACSAIVRTMQLARTPKVIKLAKDLGLSTRGDCLAEIRGFALRQVERIIVEAPVSIDSLDRLRWMVANKFRMKLEFLYSTSDVERVATENSDFHSQLRERLIAEFVDGATEGITLQREEYDPALCRYLAVVDARGSRLVRAYFTAWHEVTHLVLYPPQLSFPGFRRSPARVEVNKDPLESVVDHVAGTLAFYPPFFGPTIEQAIATHGGLTFAALDVAREAAAPSASLFATAMGSINYAHVPTLLVMADMAVKAAERRALGSGQQTFAFATPRAIAQLRVTTVAANQLAAGSDLAIRRNMRVPERSVLARAYSQGFDGDFVADEDQSWWETSAAGALPALRVNVQAARRGRFVYGLISLAA
jgi:hypothetical protein